MKKTVLLLSLCGIVLTLLPGTAGTAEKKAQLAKKYEQGLNDEVNDLIAKEEKKAAEINVESVDVLNFLGSVYLEDGRKDKARDTFIKSLKIKSDKPLVTSVIERIDK
jgi:Flp pilus assembly protein TadD